MPHWRGASIQTMTASWERRGVMAPIGCMVLVAVLAAPNLWAPLRPYDAGIAASAATFTSHGLLPYRDYWLLYGPLSGAIVAIPTAFLGSSVELLRVLGLAIISIQAGVAFVIARSSATTGAAFAIAVASVVMYPALLGLEPSSWMVALTLALLAIAQTMVTGRGGWLVGVTIGFALLARLDVGAYALVGVLVLAERRATLAGFALIAVPFAAAAVLTTDTASLIEQLIWYPLVGPRQFRGLPGPEAVIGQPAAVMLSVPLLFVPRLAILGATVRLLVARANGTRVPDARQIVVVIVFAFLSQLQTLGRADIEHFAQAATPAILLLALLYRETRAGLPRFTAVAAVVATALVVGLLSVKFLDGSGPSEEDGGVLAASAWIREATTRDEPIFVGLTSHRYTMNDTGLD